MKVLPPSFAAVAIADITTYIAFVEAFGSRAQLAAYFYTQGFLDNMERQNE